MATTVAFRIGHVVSLRSGGPPMTVRGHMADEVVLCQWFEHGACCTDGFPAAMVEEYLWDQWSSAQGSSRFSNGS